MKNSANLPKTGFAVTSIGAWFEASSSCFTRRRSEVRFLSRSFPSFLAPRSSVGASRHSPHYHIRRHSPLAPSARHTAKTRRKRACFADLRQTESLPASEVRA